MIEGMARAATENYKDRGYKRWVRGVYEGLYPLEGSDAGFEEALAAVLEELEDLGEDHGNLPAYLDPERWAYAGAGEDGFLPGAPGRLWRLARALYHPARPTGTTILVDAGEGLGAADVLAVAAGCREDPGTLVAWTEVSATDLTVDPEGGGLRALYEKVRTFDGRVVR